MDFSQNSFATGQVSSELIARQDLDKYPSSLKEAVNVNIYPTGHLRTRLGTKNILTLNKEDKIILYPYEDRLFLLIFSQDKIDVWENKHFIHEKITTINGDIGLKLKNINFTILNQEILLGDGINPLKVFSYKKKEENDYFDYNPYRFTNVPTNISLYEEFKLEQESDPNLFTEDEKKKAGEDFIYFSTLFASSDADGDEGRSFTNGKGAVGTIVDLKKGTSYKTSDPDDRTFKSIQVTLYDLMVYVQRGTFNVGDKCKFTSSPYGGLESNSTTRGTVATLKGSSPSIEGGEIKKDYGLFHEYVFDFKRLQVFEGAIRITHKDVTLVGKFIKMQGGLYKIVQYVSPSEVKALIIVPPLSEGRTENWSIQEETWQKGYHPNFMTIYQGRLILGRKLQLWASERGDYTSFTQGSTQRSPFQVNIEGDRHADIEFMATSNDLIIGTNEKEYSVGADSTGVFSYTSLRIKSASRYGSENHKPAVLGNEIIFIQSGSKKLRSLQYRFNVDNYEAQDLSYYALSLTEDNLKKVIELPSIIPTLFLLTGKGEILSCVYDKFKEVIGWSHFKQSEGKIVNTYSIVAFNNDIVYYKTFRNGRYHLEWNIPYGEKNNLIEDTYLDSTLEFQYPVKLNNTDDLSVLQQDQTYKIIDTSFKEVYKTLTYSTAGSRTNMRDLNNESNLTYKDDNGVIKVFKSDRPFTLYKLFDIVKAGDQPLLNEYVGKKLSVVADGAVMPKAELQQDDLGGYYLALDYPVYDLKIGYEYSFSVKTLPPQVNVGGNAFLLGNKTKISECKLLLEKSTLPVVNNQKKPAHETGDKTDQPTKLRSGIFNYTLSHYEELPEIKITNIYPTPVKLLGIYYRVRGGQ